jgi:DNA-directed RNA polymerase specialized sigma24 family protein
VSWRRKETPAGGHSPEAVSDERLRLLIAEDPESAWRAFIDAYTPTLLALIERAGIGDRDEAMEIYARACERLAANDYAALRRRDPSIGSLTGWLVVVVRRAAIDWIRSRAGRRRMFRAIGEMDRFHQRLFELFYWDGRRPAEAAELLSMEMKQDITLTSVFDALERIDSALSARHRSRRGCRHRQPQVRRRSHTAPDSAVPATTRADRTSGARHCRGVARATGGSRARGVVRFSQGAAPGASNTRDSRCLTSISRVPS